MTAALRAALVASLLAAFALRVVGLDALPLGLHSDEAVDGLDALSGHIAPFYPANNGREGLFALLLVPSVALLGREPLALRLPMACCGVVSVALAFALGRRLFSGDERGSWIAVAAAALISVSLFPAVLNRFGTRVSLLPVVVTVAVLLFWRARERGGWTEWAAAGAAVGVAQYAYTSARLLPLLLVGFSLLSAVVSPPAERATRWWRNWAAFALAAGMVLIPLTVVALTEPEVFFQRTVQLLGRPAPPLSDRLLATAGMFVVVGDRKPVHNLPGEPMFGLAVAPFALLGLGIAVRQWRRPATGFLLLWLLVGTVATALPSEPKPHFLHGMILVPFVFFLPALGLVQAVTWAARQGAPRLALGVAASGLVAGVFAFSAWRLAVVWPANDEVRLHFWTDVVAEARGWRGEPPVVVAVNPRYNPHDLTAVIRFIAGPQPAIVPTDDRTLPERLAAAVGEARELLVFLPDPVFTLGAPADPKDAVDVLLALAGEAVGERLSAAGRTVHYRLDRRLSMSERPADIHLGDVQLRSWTSGRRGDLVVLSLLWGVDQPIARALNVSARLVDTVGQLLAQDDRAIVSSGRLLPVSDWRPGEAHRTYHPFELPAGIGELFGRLIVYDAATGAPVAPAAELGPLE